MQVTSRGFWRTSLTAALVAVALALGVGAPAAAVVPVDDTPERSWTVNGRVYAIEVVGDVAFVGGRFSAAVSPTGQSVARRNLAAFRVSDGSLLTTWRADAGAAVRALVSDGRSLWVGGHFRSISGLGQGYLAKVSVATGAADRAFRVTLDEAVRGVDVQGGQLWAGGHFTTANGATRRHVVKLDASTAAVDQAFAANPSGRVFGLRKSPTTDVVYLAGTFATLSGASRPGLGGVSATTGRPAGAVLANTTRPAQAVDVSDDGSMVFGGADSNAVTGWRASDGRRMWRTYAMGNVQAVKYSAGMLYFGFHEGHQNDTSVKVLAAEAATGAIDQAFRPRMYQFWGVYAIDAGGGALVVGGDFTSISGVTAQGWARFG